MTLRLAVRTLVSRPVRSAVLICGFGFGIAVMAELLGVGDVMVEQVSSPALSGGGDVLVSGAAGSIGSARFVLSSLIGTPPLAGRVASASPSDIGLLYLVQGRRVTRVAVRGGIPSLERAVGDPETSGVSAWVDAPADRAWTSPDPSDVLRAMDRFHPIPDSPARAGSWAEWLYFNGRAHGTTFYLTFLVGPRVEPDRRAAAIRLQLERNGNARSFSRRAEIAEREVLARAPDLDLDGNRVRLEGTRYRIHLDLPEDGGTGRARAELTLEARPGGSVPPFTIHGAAGWLSGYVVPVLHGDLRGTIRAGGEVLPLDGGSGYHDHNWGFWKGVTWQWGQVAGQDLSILFGRVHPPADAADPERVPGFLAVLGPAGPIGFSTDLTIREIEDPGTVGPRRIEVRAAGDRLALRMDIDVESVARKLAGGGRSGFGTGATELLQLRARYHVAGRLGDRSIAFDAPGSAETFRRQ